MYKRQVQWRVGDENTTITSSYVDSSLFDGEWNQAVLVKEDTTISFYMNGELIEKIVDPAISSIDPDSDRPIYLGAQDWVGSFGSLGNYFNGGLDDVKIYSESLSSEEIESIYENRGIISGIFNNEYTNETSMLHPNPFNNELFIDTEWSSLEIINTQGDIVYITSNTDNSISGLNFEAGLYFVIGYDSNGNVIFNEKLVKE